MNELYRQDDKWDIPELSGEPCTSLFGLTYDKAENHPEILFLEFGSGEWHRCYLDAYLGFWDKTSLTDLNSIINDDYDGARKIDYLKKYGLNGQPVSRIWCDRNETYTYISIAFGAGVIKFRGFSDDSRDGDIDFISSH